MAKFSLLDEKQIARDLADSPCSRSRSRTVARYSSLFGCSAQAVYQAAARGGYRSSRKTRTDAGTIRKPVTASQVAAVASLIHATHTEKNRIPLSAESAILIAETRGLVPAGQLSPEYLNRWMREHSIAKTDATAASPHVNMRSLHPNHVHQFDTSVCAQWYLDNHGIVRPQARDFAVYKNKPGTPRPKLIRYVLVDHCTGAFFVWYTHTEQALDLIEFLYLAWAPKDFIPQRHPEVADLLNTAGRTLADLYPFRGVPRMLVSDNGAALRADVVSRLLDSLGVDANTHVPGNPRAKGAVEGMMHRFECWFEARTKLEAAPTLERLNAWAIEACAAYNADKRHSRHGLPRFDAWNAWITPETLREVPPYDHYRALASTAAVTRRVRGDLTISFKPDFNAGASAPSEVHTYRIPNPNLAGTEVEVRVNYYEYPQIRVRAQGSAEDMLLAPVPKDAFGFNADRFAATFGASCASHPHTAPPRALGPPGATAPTPADQRRLAEAAKQSGMGVSPMNPDQPQNLPAQVASAAAAIHDLAASSEISNLKSAPGATLDTYHPPVLHTAPAYLPRTGEPVTIAPSASVLLSRIEARARILDALNRDYADLLPGQRAALDAITGAVPISEIPTLMDQVSRGVPSAAVIALTQEHAQ